MQLIEACLAAAFAHAATVAAQSSYYDDDASALEARDFHGSFDLDPRNFDDFDLDIRGEDDEDDEDISSPADGDSSTPSNADGRTSPSDECTSFINIDSDGRPYHVHRCTHADGSVTTTPLTRKKDARSLFLLSGDAPSIGLDPFQQMFNSWFRPSPLQRMLREFSTPAHRGHSHMLMIPPQGGPSSGSGIENLMHSLLSAGHSGLSSSTSSIMSHSNINGKGMTCTSSLHIGPDGVPHRVQKCTSTGSKSKRPQLTLPGTGSRVFNGLSASTKKKVLKALRNKRILDLEDVPTRGEIKTWSKHDKNKKSHKKHDHDHDEHDKHKDEEKKDEHKSEIEVKHDDIKRGVTDSDDFEDLFSREAEADPDLFIDSEEVFARDVDFEPEATLVSRDPTADPEPEPEAEPFAEPIAGADAGADVVADPEPLP